MVDPYSSAVVKRIYEMQLQKYSYGAIIQVLNAENILSPSAYCQEIHGKSTSKSRADGKWTKDSLNAFFQQVAYKGDTANCKKTVKSYKNHKQIYQPMENWIIAENTHEAIVSRKDWQKCYDMITHLGCVRRTKESEVMPFTGLLICQDCNCKLRHNHSYYRLKNGAKMRNNNYQCPTYSTSGTTACSSHYIGEKDLLQLVIADIRNKASEIIVAENAVRERYFQLKNQSVNLQLKTDSAALKKSKKRLTELEKLIQATFEKTILSGLSPESANKLIHGYESEKSALTEKISQLTAKINAGHQLKNDVDTFIKLIKKHVNITDLDRATAVTLIDKIIISKKIKGSDEPREIIIYYNFIGVDY